ncbi:MAG: radical SAM protein [Clostridia bacterium]|nr:radical SAM protein [Clostridia bacterium]
MKDKERICTLCPRQCGIDRSVGRGFCGEGDTVRIARYQKHEWEEPPISGTGGSGTVFFTGCTLKCVFCQNYEVSRGMGYEVTVGQLADIFLELQEMGCHNVSMVTGSHFTPQILRALDTVRDRLHIPVVWNCGGYESIETLRRLEGYVDIYIPDMKYQSSALSARYSACPDYFEKALPAIGEMLRQTGAPRFDEQGILQKGVIVRHLVLPGCYKDSIAVLDALHEHYGSKDYLLSLMSQYTPMPSCKAYPEIDRPITSFEYRKVSDRALALGFDGYFQQRSASSKTYIPPFGENDGFRP